MKNTLGNSVSVTLFGESHGESIGAVIDGLAPGITVNEKYIASRLALRRPSGKTGTKRVEKDNFRIISGVFGGKTTGTPLCILIPNENVKSKDYDQTSFLARPGHTDYTARCKYHGYEDFRGSGHFSGRLTAAITAAGAILEYALEQKGIYIGTHIARCAKINDRNFKDYNEDIKALGKMKFAALDENKGKQMQEAIIAAGKDGDSVGGILETAIIGLPAGLGEPWFDSLESVLSHALFSIPAVKGVQFGNAFKNVDLPGSKYNDAFAIKDGKVITKTNNNAGINGGISNGMPVVFSCAVKPTPSIYKTQSTVDLNKMEESVIEIKGRHDPAVIHRARAVVDAITAIVIADMLALRYGTDYLGE